MRPINIIKLAAPKAMPAYLAAFTVADPLFIKSGINTPLRFAQFAAQALMETDGLTITRENMNYSAARLLEVFGAGHSSADVSAAEANAIAHHPDLIANRVYGTGKLGQDLGNTKPGDGFRFRGAGIFQTTGRYNFRQLAKECGVDFENHPEWVLFPDYALLPALSEWTAGKCNGYADNHDILSISRIINLGNAKTHQIPNGFQDRMAWFNKLWMICGHQPFELQALPGPMPPIPTVIKPPEPIPAIVQPVKTS
jgi:putative chitinase